ncbi:MAG: exo-alpha-sialidase [bacterium]|nr:exo-alpha-sialidase [bacterium]
MRVMSKEICIPMQNDTGVFPGFVTYIDKEKPTLLHRFGWVDASDTYDDFHERVSTDNGETWSEPVLKLKSTPVDGGRLRYVENSAYYDADTNTLITLVYRMVYPNDHIDVDVHREIVVQTYDPSKEARPEPDVYDFGFPQGLAISFCFPIKTAAGRILVPAMHAELDDDGEVRNHPESNLLVYQVRMMIGEYQPDGTLAWRVGEPLRAGDDQSTRGFSESAPLELKDGRIALLCRGSNAHKPERPGYKWLSFSEDGGETWAKAVPFSTDDGTPIESSATGCALFRSIRNGRLYFIGNLCARGERADGNWPRSPLYIAEVQEEPFALKRDTITVIDERDADDSKMTQISNFRYYQDRANGDVVVFSSRFGERDAKKWKMADHYRYRVRID